MIKKILRLNVTNQCNLSCASCPIKANIYNNSFMKFNVFQNILCEHRNIPLEVVLEGGEPFLHPQIFLFLEYLKTVPNFKKVIISTNGYVEEYFDTLLDTINRLNICVQLNVAITSSLIESCPSHMEMCKKLFEEEQSKKKFHLTFDVTYTSEEDKDSLTSIIKEYEIPLDYCTFSIVRAYGALKDTEYPKLEEGKREWHCYASDGTYFCNDLSARADYELSLCNEDEVPIFDIVNHRGLWLSTKIFLADISFETQDDIKQSVKNFQLDYIHRNTPECMFPSYISQYMYISGGVNPVTSYTPVELEHEVVDGLAHVMDITPDIERFYQYKEFAMKLCTDIAYFEPAKGVKTNADDCCKCKC